MQYEYFGAFKKLQNDLETFQAEGYYDETLSEFMRDTSWQQSWDVESLSEHVNENDHVIVDLGVGDGRLIKQLQDGGTNSTFIGVNSSPSARNRFLKRQEECNFNGEFILADFISDKIPLNNVDFVYFGAISVNGLTTIKNVSKIFSNVERCMSSVGRFAISVYTNSSVSRFPELNGILTPEIYTTESGKERIIWRGLKYEAPFLIHNSFIDRRSEGLEPVLCSHHERIWREQDITEIANILGWTVAYRNISQVGDGGAQGYEVATISFSKNDRQ